MHKTLDALFDGLWNDYLTITPSAEKIHTLLERKDGHSNIVNDHIALRTFNLDKVSLDKLSKHFEVLGYTARGDYNFETKKLTAKHFEHSDVNKPKVFISELRVEDLSKNAQDIIHMMVDSVDSDAVLADNFLYSGTHWQVSYQQYLTLLEESEYAAWMSAWGYRANHFTVSVNHLKKIQELEAVNTLLKEAGFRLNTSGGEIKGGKDVCLAQSSTMADSSEVIFKDSKQHIPSCFYEFAQRFTLPNGQLYQGFVAASADKIFESTNVN